MGERRALLGTGAVLFGVGTALLAGSPVAAAEADDAPAADTAAAGGAEQSGQAAPSRRATRTATAPAPAAATRAAQADSDGPAQSVARSGTDRTQIRPQSPQSRQSRQAVRVPAAVEVAAPRVEAPAAQTGPAAPAPEAAAPAVVAAPAPAEAAPAPAPAPRTAPVTALEAALALIPGSPTAPAAALPALAAFTGQRQSAAAAAVIGAAPAAAAPPNPLLPTDSNGVTGVQTGSSRLAIPGAFIGNTVAADWYFPTQADGSVEAQGVIWLQHGFGATNTFYSALATDLAQRTNSIVVAPTLSSIPFTLSGGCLVCAGSQQAAAEAFLDPDRTVLIDSAVAAGYTGDTDVLLGRFLFAGHSAGGGFSAAAGSDYVEAGSEAQDAALAGVLMFDGVSNGALDGSFDEQLAALAAAGKPVYQIAAPAQSWNLFGATTNALAAARPGEFTGVVLQDGSHVDSMLGVNLVFDIILQLVTKRVPAGNTAAVYTLANGWINDMYAGATPEAPQYGLYAASNQQIVMGPTFAYGLPSVVANQMGLIDGLFSSLLGLFGFSLPDPVNTGFNGLSPAAPVALVGNGVTGVRTGTAVLDIPCGEDNFYAAPATWYFPTQADGSTQANGVIWLQHGFLGFNEWYSDMAQALAQETNSIVVAPTIFWFDTPLCPGCFLGSPLIREGAATMFLDGREQLNNSARLTGLFTGTLPENFILTGHSAGGNFATAVGAIITATPAVDDLLGVVMFDGVSRAPLFTDSLAALDAAGIPDYQISAPPQRWNAYDVASELMTAAYPDRFNGVQILNGSHSDVISGDSLFADLAEILSDIVVRPSPPGGKAAVRTFATGWVNDIYAGKGPTDPLYGIYGNPNDGTYVANQQIVMGVATAATLPSPPPVDINQYAGTWYEQGSVRQFFSIGLVNTTAVYTPRPDGAVTVENSGNYFFNNGPKVEITGAAVPVNAANTRLNVGFGGTPGDAEPGNYWILNYAPDYSWAIVSDSSFSTGFILTREKIISEETYQELLTQARTLGISGLILRTTQYPVADPAAVPAGVTL